MSDKSKYEQADRLAERRFMLFDLMQLPKPTTIEGVRDTYVALAAFQLIALKLAEDEFGVTDAHVAFDSLAIADEAAELVKAFLPSGGGKCANPNCPIHGTKNKGASTDLPPNAA